jgi:hypothetical protein
MLIHANNYRFVRLARPRLDRLWQRCERIRSEALHLRKHSQRLIEDSHIIRKLAGTHSPGPRSMTGIWATGGLSIALAARSMTLSAMLQPLPSELLEADDVSTLVNSPENDTAECIQPVSPNQ